MALWPTAGAEAATVAKVIFPTVARSAPDGGKVVALLGTRAAWNGGPNRLLVLGGRDDASGRRWLRVLLPLRPNGLSGWMRADLARLSITRWRLRISTSRRTLTVLRAGRVVRRTRVVVGAAATPTPHGRFAVSEAVRQPDPRGFIGPWALHLTAHSNVLDNYGGGPGRVAIHGRSGASFADPLGSARSHGCIRIPNSTIRWLAYRVRAGTPVVVRP